MNAEIVIDKEAKAHPAKRVAFEPSLGLQSNGRNEGSAPVRGTGKAISDASQAFVGHRHQSWAKHRLVYAVVEVRKSS